MAAFDHAASGGAIEEDSAFLIDASGGLGASPSSATSGAKPNGVGHRMPARILPDAVRNDMLAAVNRGANTANVLAIACGERLPAGAKMRLVWGQGVEALNGARTSRAERFSTRCASRSGRLSVASARSPTRRVRRFPTCASVTFPSMPGKPPKRVLVGPMAHAHPGADGRGLSREYGHQPDVQAPVCAECRIQDRTAGGSQGRGRAQSGNAASFPLSVKTGTLPPLAKFPGAFGILELKEGGVLPVTLRMSRSACRLPT